MPLFSRFILRQLATERVRTGTTVLGIALGIAVIVAIQLTNGSAIRGFQAALQSLAGRTSVQIVGSGAGIDERELADLVWLERMGEVSPVVEGDVLTEVAGGQPEQLRVLGIDILRDRALREYHAVDFGRGRQPTAREFLDLLLDTDAVILTERFAKAHGLDVGDSLDVTADDRVATLRVRALLTSDGPAAAFDGRVAVMDIAAAQVLLGRLGWIDRLDVAVRPGLSIDDAIARIAARLPPELRARRPSEQTLEAAKMLEAFQVNLTALSYIALLVGLFLVYNTVSISVISRRDEIGTLRALGVTRREVLRLFLGEAALLALVGCALGLALGRVLAARAVDLTALAVKVLYVATAAGQPTLGWWHVGLAFGVGLPLALLAAAVPAAEASRIAPIGVIKGTAALESGLRLHRRQLLGPLALFGLAIGLARLPAIAGVPLWGYAAALAVVFGAAWVVPAAVHGLTWLGARMSRRLFVLEAWLANASLGGSVPRLSISVAALAVSLALAVAIAVMVASFRDTVTYWVAQTLRADLFVGPEMQGVAQRGRLSADAERVVRAHPAVLAVDQYRSLDVSFEGRLIVVGAGDLPVLLQHGNLLFKEPRDARAAVRDAIGRDEVLASESFAVRFGRNVGDQVWLDTITGSRPFRIAAVYFDYSTDRGILVMDRRTFARHYGSQPPESLAVYLRPGADAGQVRRNLLAAFGDRRRVVVRTNAMLRRRVLEVFDATFAITYALELVAIVVAMLGVVATLLTLIIDRRHELAMLRLLGTGRAQVRRVVVLEAAMIGLVSQAVGAGVGIGLSLILIYVINLQSFGWTLQFHLPVRFLLVSTAVLICTTTLAGIYPAHRAATLDVTGQGQDE